MQEKPALCMIVEEFEAVQDKYKEWGATDSEPNGQFVKLMRHAVAGLEFPEVKPEDWQLFTSKPGWKRAAQRLTSAAKKTYTKIRNAKHAVQVSDWYGWV